MKPCSNLKKKIVQISLLMGRILFAIGNSNAFHKKFSKYMKYMSGQKMAIEEKVKCYFCDLFC